MLYPIELWVHQERGNITTALTALQLKTVRNHAPGLSAHWRSLASVLGRVNSGLEAREARLGD
jgi:hypothetical protein